MSKTRAEILKMIDGPLPGHVFAGTEVTVPAVGDRVRVVRGRDVGAEFEVLAVRGNVYSAEQRVYVAAGGDAPVWYRPWDLEIIGHKA